jgi:hypothetical protein
MSPLPRATAALPARGRVDWRSTWQETRARIGSLIRPLGWAGAAGMVCLLAATVLWWGGVRGKEEATQQLRQEVRLLREKSRTTAPPVRSPDAAEQLRSFHAFFPPRGQINITLRELNRLATERQLVLASGDYKFTEEKNLHLARYELRLPVRGSYPQLYSLIAAALNAMPSLALDEIVIKRESRQAGEVEAMLRLSLYVRED